MSSRILHKALPLIGAALLLSGVSLADTAPPGHAEVMVKADPTAAGRASPLFGRLTPAMLADLAPSISVGVGPADPAQPMGSAKFSELGQGSLNYSVVPPSLKITAAPPPASDGTKLKLSWAPAQAGRLALLRSTDPEKGFVVVADDLDGAAGTYVDTLTTDPLAERPPAEVYYRLAAVGPIHDQPRADLEASRAELAIAGASATEDQKREAEYLAGAYAELLGAGATPAVKGVPDDAWFNLQRWPVLLVILAMGALILYYRRRAQAGEEIYIRRIPGVDAIEEAVGRATEMGKPILYVPGVGEFQEIQTIAGLLILGRVAEIVATYESDVIVCCTYPIIREVADEAVHQGYLQAGRADAYKPSNVRFISPEQFAFTAGTNGVILREKPAANLYMGQFFAESLIFAETGFINQSIQIAGTAETTQIPFFVTACDYTLIGEELYAVSAYLTREPRLTSSLKAADVLRIAAIVALVVGTALLALDVPWLRDAFVVVE